MTPTNLEKLKHDQYAAERKLTAAQHKGKCLQSELKRLNRSEHTHRLCMRSAMLEAFLQEPSLLTDEDVMELLAYIFHGEAPQKKLKLLLERRGQALELDDSGNETYQRWKMERPPDLWPLRSAAWSFPALDTWLRFTKSFVFVREVRL